METQFRNSFRGFNREDVISYLQNLNDTHRNEVADLKAKIQQQEFSLQQERDTIAGLTDDIAKLNGTVELLKAERAANETAYKEKELELYRNAGAAEQAAREHAAQLVQEAQNQADSLHAEAEAEYAKIIAEANAKAEKAIVTSEKVKAQLAEMLGLLNGASEELA